MHPHGPPMEILIRDALQRHPEEIPGPGTLQETAERFADNHPLKRQAILVMDAVESVTNGMENPDVFAKLSEIPLESTFHPWVNLVTALRAFYRGDFEEMAGELDKIPAGSPPGTLTRVLRHLSSLENHERPLKGIEKQLMKSVGNPGGPLFDTFLQICQALENDRENIFPDAVGYLMKELYGTRPDISKRLFLWGFSTLREKGWEEEILFAHGRLIYGVSESERLRSLSLFDVDPEKALLHWSRYSQTVGRESAGRQGPDADTLAIVENYLVSKIRGKETGPEKVPPKPRTSVKTAQLELFN